METHEESERRQIKLNRPTNSKPHSEDEARGKLQWSYHITIRNFRISSSLEWMEAPAGSWLMMLEAL